MLLLLLWGARFAHLEAFWVARGLFLANWMVLDPLVDSDLEDSGQILRS